MKKTGCILLAILTLAALAGCSSAADGGDGFPSVTNSAEYVLYQNIFYNATGDDYIGQEMTKTGTFTVLYDRFNDCTRYYVWGYYDNTKCCDWQWEFVPESASELPANGSLVEVTGTFESDGAALDGYWLTGASVAVESAYEGPDCDVDMTCMSATLERVQLLNMQYYYEDFEGMTVCMYGRVETASSLQHPYYDGVWSQEIVTGGALPAIGSMVVVSGAYEGGVVENASLAQTSVY